MAASRGSVRGAAYRCICTVLACVAAGCRPAVEQGIAPHPVGFVLEVPASFDSTVRLAKFALRAIDGTLQLPRVRPHMTSVSLHYSQGRRGGGHTEVAIIAAVRRSGMGHPAAPTRVELSAWLLDVAHQLTPAQRRAGIPITPITTNAPALNRPRAVTSADTAHYQALGLVLESFLQHGARRLP